MVEIHRRSRLEMRECSLLHAWYDLYSIDNLEIDLVIET